MGTTVRNVALVTGGSRGIGAATAVSLANRGFDVAITYRNKATRAAGVVADIERYMVRALSLPCDMTRQDDIARVASAIRKWSGRLQVLVLNASGGLERDLVAADDRYPMRLNCDAQVDMVEALLPLMQSGGSIIFITSHWAHLYSRIEQLPGYTSVAAGKWAGEQALRARQVIFREHGVRLLVVTGDLIEGTITPKLLERDAPGLIDLRREIIGNLPSAEEMGDVISAAATDPSLPSGHTIVVGGKLESLV